MPRMITTPAAITPRRMTNVRGHAVLDVLASKAQPHRCRCTVPRDPKRAFRPDIKGDARDRWIYGGLSDSVGRGRGGQVNRRLPTQRRIVMIHNADNFACPDVFHRIPGRWFSPHCQRS